MRKKLLLAAMALLVAVNALVLANVAANRRGEPDSTLTLTERELSVGWRGLNNSDNSGIALELTYNVPDGREEWLGEQKLRELGFDVAVTRPGEAKAPLPRRAWVAFEYEGPQWQAQVREQEERVEQVRAGIAAAKSDTGDLERAQQRLAELKTAESRLIPVDAARDGEALRARYGDRSRYLITAAEVSYHLEYQTGAPPRVHGYIMGVLTSPVTIPARFHAALRQAATPREGAKSVSPRYMKQPPRYQVTLHYGTRFEPWVVDVTAISAGSP